ncbi:unnamed protein product [Closterium sp. NIES-53]
MQLHACAPRPVGVLLPSASHGSGACNRRSRSRSRTTSQTSSLIGTPTTVRPSSTHCIPNGSARSTSLPSRSQNQHLCACTSSPTHSNRSRSTPKASRILAAGPKI